jgi:hypothetical protein
VFPEKRQAIDYAETRACFRAGFDWQAGTHDCVQRAASADKCVKFWEVIADNLSKAGWSRGCVATVDSNGQTIFVADAHRDNGKRFIVTADEKLRAFSNFNESRANHSASQMPNNSAQFEPCSLLIAFPS